MQAHTRIAPAANTPEEVVMVGSAAGTGTRPPSHLDVVAAQGMSAGAHTHTSRSSGALAPKDCMSHSGVWYSKLPGSA